MRKKIVFFGSIGIAKKILEEIILTRDVEIAGVCCEKCINSWRDEESVYEFCQRKGIPILTDEDILEIKPDLGVSVRYNRIIKQNIIDSFKLGIVNTHGGILPEYRGSYCNINAIINNEKEFGVTLHYIDAGVDCGDIVQIKKINISDEMTGFDLYKISEKFCYELIAENIDDLLKGSNQRVAQGEYIKNGHNACEYKAKETLALKEIELDRLNEDKSMRIIRAFDSNSHEPAYVVINNKKVYLRARY